MNERFESIVENIVEAIAEQGYYVGDSIFDEALSKLLQARALALLETGALRAAKIGRGDASTGNNSIRSDRTHWLDDAPINSVERAATDAVAALCLRLNETLFIGAVRTELHFAHYQAGAFYKTHRDRFTDDDARVISVVFYLNDDWTNDAGGELVLYAANSVESEDSHAEANSDLRELRRVLPRTGTMVAFRSEIFPHQVLPATRDRFSLTGWMRRSVRR